MSGSRYELDMTSGSIFTKILKYVVPIMLSNILMQAYNAADIIVVSRFAGSGAMASVGATASLNNLLINLFVGLSAGAGVVVSRSYGSKDPKALHEAVHTAVFFSFIAGIASFIAGQSLTVPLLRLIDTPEGAVFNGAVLYMRIIFVGMPANLVFSFCAAILRAVGDTKRPLYILAASGAVNVVLNLITVIVFDMGVAGVAAATAVSNYLSMFAAMYILLRTDGEYKLEFGKIKLYKSSAAVLLKVGIPAGFQASTFSVANTVIQSAVNSFGAAAIAGNAAAANIEGFLYAIKNAFSQATVTSVSQNYGAGKPKRISRSIKTTLISVIIGGLAVGVLVNLFSRQLLGIYIVDSPEAMDFGVKRMMIASLPYFLSCTMDVLIGALRGIGYSALSALISFVGTCGFRLIWVWFIFPLHRTFEMLYLCWPLSWLLITAVNLITIFALRKHALSNMLVNSESAEDAAS